MPTLSNSKFSCSHYKRNCLLICPKCNRTYPCRHCHDKNETHPLITKNISSIVCLFCGITQKSSQTCISCNQTIAEYFCSECNFFSNEIEVFHCSKCTICRLGNQSLYEHCDKCSVCIEKTSESHKHISSGVKNNCPICAEYLLYSNKQVVLLRCGHSIHEECHKTNLVSSAHCPICFKMVGDDRIIREKIHMMIKSNENEVVKHEINPCKISCFECGSVSEINGFLLFNECNKCGSFNTKLISD